MKLRSFLLVLVIMLGISILAVSPELLEAAKKEGKVVVYSITSRISNAAEAFTAK